MAGIGTDSSKGANRVAASQYNNDPHASPNSLPRPLQRWFRVSGRSGACNWLLHTPGQSTQLHAAPRSSDMTSPEGLTVQQHLSGPSTHHAACLCRTFFSLHIFTHLHPHPRSLPPAPHLHSSTISNLAVSCTTAIPAPGTRPTRLSLLS